MEGRIINDVFVAAGVAEEYAWNIYPIDGSDILCSITRTDREICFIIDIYLSALPLFVYNNTESIKYYLCLADFKFFPLKYRKTLLRSMKLLMQNESTII